MSSSPDLDDRSRFSPRVNRMFAIGMLVLAAAVLAAAVAGAAGASFFRRFQVGGIGIGLVEWFLGAMYWARARANAEGERFSPRTLRVVALVLFILGAAIIALSLYSNVEGAGQ